MSFYKFKDYSALYEMRLNQSEFLSEQNITAEDIIKPIENLFTQEVVDIYISEGIISSLKSGLGKVKDFFVNIGKAVSNFFKNFSLSKLTSSITDSIKKWGTKVIQNIKKSLKSLSVYALKNGLVSEDNKPNFKVIWSHIIKKVKEANLITPDSGIKDEDLSKVGGNVVLKESMILESENDISDSEVKYYGFFEKVAHAMGIKNARFNGVVSQIMKKGTYGVVIMSIFKMIGFSVGGAIAGLGLSPVAMGIIGGMLLMAGLIILTIWLCKPYPTLNDCLAYLQMAFGGNLASNNYTNIFIQNINIVYQQNITVIDYVNNDVDVNINASDNSKDTTSSTPSSSSTSSSSSSYSLMIKNLKSIQSMITTYRGVSLEGQGGSEEEKEQRRISKDKRKDKELEIGKLYYFTNSKGVTKKVKLISLTNDTGVGPDKKWLTKDDIDQGKLPPNSASIIYPDKDGKYSNKSREAGVDVDKLKPVKEGLSIYRFEDMLLEKEFSKGPRNTMVGKEDSYTTEAISKIRKSIKSFLDDKLKIDKDSTLVEVIDDKMDSSTKKGVKDLYSNIYEYLFGKYSKTLSDVGSLYTENVVTDSKKNIVLAEKIARLYKRTKQLDESSQDLYGTMGEFGQDLKEFNSTMSKIMESMKK